MNIRAGQQFLSRLSLVDLAGIGACVLILAAAWFTVLGPAVARRSRAATAREAMAAERQRLAAATAAGRGARAELSNVRAAIVSKSLPLAGEDQLNTRLAVVASLAAECGLLTEDVRPGAVLAGNRFDTIPVRMSGRGKFTQAVDFLHRMRVKNPDMKLSAIRLSAGDENSDPAFEFTFRWCITKAGTIAAVDLSR